MRFQMAGGVRKIASTVMPSVSEAPSYLSFRGVLSEAKDAEESHEGIPRFARDDKPPACHFVRDGVS